VAKNAAKAIGGIGVVVAGDPDPVAAALQLLHPRVANQRRNDSGRVEVAIAERAVGIG
jgi:hypothetical protein